jgi:hypothetical protein
MATGEALKMGMSFESIEDVKNNLPEGHGAVVYPIKKRFHLYADPVNLMFRVSGKGINPALCQTLMANLNGCTNLRKKAIVVVNSDNLHCTGDKFCMDFCEHKGFPARR